MTYTVYIIIIRHNKHVILLRHHVKDLNQFLSLILTWWISIFFMSEWHWIGQFPPVYHARWKIKFNQSWAAVAVALMEMNQWMAPTPQMLWRQNHLQTVSRAQRSARKAANSSWLAKSWPSRKNFGLHTAVMKRSDLAALTWWSALAIWRFNDNVKFNVVGSRDAKWFDFAV